MQTGRVMPIVRVLGAVNELQAQEREKDRWLDMANRQSPQLASWWRSWGRGERGRGIQKKARLPLGKPGLEIGMTGLCSKWSSCETSEDRACFCTSHVMILANAFFGPSAESDRIIQFKIIHRLLCSMKFNSPRRQNPQWLDSLCWRQ